MYTDQYIQRELRKVCADIDMAITRLSNANRIEDIKRLMVINVPPILRSMRGSVPGLTRVKATAEARALDIFSQKIESIKAETDSERKIKLCLLARSECELLRGDLGSIYHRVFTKVSEQMKIARLSGGLLIN